MPTLREVFSFPDPVNEKAARAVAAQVLATSALTLFLSIAVDPRWLWLTAALAVGFLARVLTGPTLSLFGQIATRVLAPRLGPAKVVPGPPKRFAQGMGLGMTTIATVLVAFGQTVPAQVLVGALVVAASLEAIFALCLGCKIFALGMRIGVIPESVCEDCANVSARFQSRADAAAAAHSV